MTVQGKKRITLWVTPEYYDKVQETIERGKGEGGMSAMFDNILKKAAETIDSAKIKKNKKIRYIDVLKLLLKGAVK